MEIPEIQANLWDSINRTDINENITRVDYTNGQDSVSITLNMTGNVLHFDIEGRLVSANLLTFQFPKDAIRLGENRTGIPVGEGLGFLYLDWSDLGVFHEYLDNTKRLRMDIRSSPNFKLDPEIGLTNRGYETGDFTGWSTKDSGSSSITVVSTGPIEGNFSVEAISTASGDNEAASDQGFGGAFNEVFFRFVVNITEAYTGVEEKHLASLKKGGLLGSRVGITFSSGSMRVQHEFLTDSGVVVINTGVAVTPMTILCFELFYKINATTPDKGTALLFLNEVLISNQTDIDNDTFATMSDIVNGQDVDAGADDSISFKVDANRLNSDTSIGCDGFLPPVVVVPPGGLTDVVDIIAFGPTGLFLFLILGFVFLFLGNHFKIMTLALISVFLFGLSIFFYTFPLAYVIDSADVLSVQSLPLFPAAPRFIFLIFLFTFWLFSVILTMALSDRARARLGFA